MAKTQKIGGYIRPRINKNGEITSYQVNVYTGKTVVNGKSKLHYERFSAATEEEAEELFEIKKAEATLKLKRHAQPSMMTISEFIHQVYLPDYVNRGLKPSTQRAYLCQSRYVDATIGNIRLRDLSGQDLQHMFYDLLEKSPLSEKPLSYRTVTDIRRFLSVVLTTAIDLHYLHENPLEGVRLRKPSDSEPTGNYDIYTKEQVAKLIKGISGTSMHMPIVLALDSGMRRGELCGLTFDHVLWEEGAVEIVQNLTHGRGDKACMVTPKTKSGKRKVYLTSYTMDLLRKAYVDYKKRKLAMGKAFIDTGAVVSKENGDFFLPHSLYNKFTRTCKALGLPHIRFHGLRSTSITLAIEGGASIKAVAERVGHKDCTITQNVYLQCTHKMVEHTTGVMEGIISEVVNN